MARGFRGFRVAAIQMTSTEDHKKNLATAIRLARQAAGAGATLLAFPENFAFLRTTPRGRLPDAVARELPGRLSDLARELGVWLLAGSIPEAIRGTRRVYNTSILYSADGFEVARYRKMHLFDIRMPGRVVFEESRSVRAGRLPVVAETPHGRVGLSICYDLRFPELYRHLARANAEVLFVPAAFTSYTGRSHWIPLLRARAIENLCWVVAPAQVGRHGGDRRSFGHSAVVDPWGKVVAERSGGEGVLLARVDLERAAEAREGLPCIDHICDRLLGASRVRRVF